VKLLIASLGPRWRAALDQAPAPVQSRGERGGAKFDFLLKRPAVQLRKDLTFFDALAVLNEDRLDDAAARDADRQGAIGLVRRRLCAGGRAHRQHGEREHG
jgi:hypothetical protein